jgi:hypothetical protein
MNSATQAQVMVDMSKITCEHLLKGTQNSVESAIWISGYYNGLRKNTMFDLNQFKTNADAVVKACRSNPKNTVMQTVDTLSAKK